MKQQGNPHHSRPTGRQLQQIQDACNTIIEQDTLFCASYAGLRSQFTAGLIAAHQFHNIVRWLVASSLRRAGLSLKTARLYQQLSVFAA